MHLDTANYNRQCDERSLDTTMGARMLPRCMTIKRSMAPLGATLTARPPATAAC